MGPSTNKFFFAIHSSEPKPRNVNASESSLKTGFLELVSHLKYPTSNPSLVHYDFRIRP